jgi:hypothetical protein
MRTGKMTIPAMINIDALDSNIVWIPDHWRGQVQQLLLNIHAYCQQEHISTVPLNLSKLTHS